MPLAFTVIGKYQVVDRLDEGGMGTLYLARDPTLDRLVAIKVLRGDFDSKELRERFSREARSISRLRHPNIVTIFEYGDFHDQPFIAMEYISGESLAEIVQRRAVLPLARRLQMIEEVCAGMAYAHRGKIVHRDLKPANLMVDAEGGLIKILDFGIASSLEATSARLTQLIGTPNYMSPEQVSGKRVDHRSDIFSIGAVFYELLCYRRAFDGESDVAILEKIQREDPVPIARLVSGLNPAIARIVSKALERDPANRYQDLDAMRRDIASVREGTALSADEATVIVSRGAGAASRSATVPPSLLEKRRAGQIRQYLEAADAAVDNRDYNAAIESCEQVLMLDRANARALALVETARVALEDAALHDHLRRARELLNAQAFTAAEEALTQALTLRASDPAALALQRELRRMWRERERAQERAAAAELALARARVCVAEGAFEPAVRAASEALAHAPDLAEAGNLRELALAAIESRAREEELQQQVSEALETAHRRFEAGEFEAAIADLERFEPLTPSITEALEELRRRVHEREARAAADEARRQFERGATDQAVAALEHFEPPHPLVAEALADLRSRQGDLQRRVSQTLQAAQRQFETGDYAAAVAGLERFEPAMPAVADALNGLRRRIDAIETERRAEEEERRRRQTETQRRLQLIARLAAGAQHLEHQRLDEARREVDAALAIDAADADAQQLQSRVQRAFDERRRAGEIDRRAHGVVEEAHRHFERGDSENALAALEHFEPRHPLVSEALSELRARAEALASAKRDEERRQQEEAARLAQPQWLADRLREARAASAETRFAEALRMLDDIRRRMPEASGVSELREATLAAQSSHQDVERRRREREIEEQRRVELLAAAKASIDTHLSRGELQLAEFALSYAERQLSARDELITQRARIEALRRSTEEREVAARSAPVAVPSTVARPHTAETTTRPPIGSDVQPRTSRPSPSLRSRAPASYLLAAAVAAVVIVVLVMLAVRRPTPVGTPALVPPPTPPIIDARTLPVTVVPVPNVEPGRVIEHETGTSSPVLPPARSPAPAPPTRPPVAPAPPVDTRAADVAAIERLLDRYVAAYNAMDATAIAQIDASLSSKDLARRFEEISSYSVRLVGTRIEIDGDTATVTCVRQIVAVMKRGNQRAQNAPSTTFTLRRAGTAWKIQNAR